MEQLWVYDQRTNKHFTPKVELSPAREHLQEFVD